MSNTAKALTDELFDVFRGLRDEKIQAKVAKEMNNSAGKIMTVQKAQLLYHEQRKEKPNMGFFK
jgi:hypothetical protein